VNVLIHILTSFCVYWLTQITLRTPYLAQFFQAKQIGWISFWSAVIFLTHPVQTQAVSFVTQRAVGLATLFYLLTIIFYIKGRLSGRKENIFFALGFMILGLLTKEMIITVPVALIFYEHFFLKNPWRISLKHLWIFFVAWMIIPIVLWQNQTGSVLGLKDQLLGQGFNWPYFLTELNVLRTYGRLFFFPVHLTHDYLYPISQSFFETAVFISVFWHAAWIFLAVKLYRKARLLSFCILWFYLTTSLEVLVVSIVNRKVIFEHWMYLPMVGLSVGFVYVVHRWIVNERWRNMVVVAIGIVLSLLSIDRNQVWRGEIGFWVDNISKSPNNAHAYLGLAKAYDRKEMTSQAIFYYYKALSHDSHLKQALNNLGCIYMDQEKDGLAQEYFKKILVFDPHDGKAYNNLAYLDFLNGRHKEAVQNYEMSLQYQPPYPEGFFYAGQSYLVLRQKEKAKEYLQKARQLYQKQSRLKEAQEAEQILVENR
jgi:Tfp pilus assembly protein PilF